MSCTSTRPSRCSTGCARIQRWAWRRACSLVDALLLGGRAGRMRRPSRLSCSRAWATGPRRVELLGTVAEIPPARFRPGGRPTSQRGRHRGGRCRAVGHRGCLVRPGPGRTAARRWRCGCGPGDVPAGSASGPSRRRFCTRRAQLLTRLAELELERGIVGRGLAAAGGCSGRGAASRDPRRRQRLAGRWPTSP